MKQKKRCDIALKLLTKPNIFLIEAEAKRWKLNYTKNIVVIDCHNFNF